MAAPGSPFSHEFTSSNPPATLVGNLALRAEDFGAMGYDVEGHSSDSLVLARKFTPTLAWGVPLFIAAMAFAIPVLSPDAGVDAAESGGRIAFFCILAAILLSLVLKTTERISFTAAPDRSGSRVIISGKATPYMQEYLLALNTDEDESDGFERAHAVAREAARGDERTLGTLRAVRVGVLAIGGLIFVAVLLVTLLG